MNKAYERINWKNYPSEETAVNESNLNRMDAALNEVDTRVVTHETTKLDVATANTMVRNISLNERTGIFTITYLNGSTKELDTKLEKIATNFEYDAERQKLILTLVDGSTQEIDISDLITEYEFENSAYINWTVESGKVKAEIIDGSITADKLQPNFLADCRLSESNASMSANASKHYSEEAKKYASEAKGSAELANTEKIVDIMNQATTTWVMPDYMENRDEQPYVCGIGTPEENGYSADDYNDENGYGEPYLDVRSGMVYHAIRVKDLPLTYGWVEKEQLESVQNALDKKANKGWTLWRETGYIATDWLTLTITTSLSKFSEINVVSRRYTNQVIDSIVIPTDLFRTLSTTNNAFVKIERNDISLDVQYVNDNTIRARNTGTTQSVMFSIYAR